MAARRIGDQTSRHLAAEIDDQADAALRRGGIDDQGAALGARIDDHGAAHRRADGPSRRSRVTQQLG